MDATRRRDRRTWMILLAILAVGATLRMVRLTQTPPGINQDEASNVWNAYCLLRTGMDQVGAHWPIFYSHCLGENRSTLYLYYLMPFQAVGGLNIETARFASAVGGVAALLVVYYLGSRLFNSTVGLIATGLMCLNPWHIQQSRWAHEASIVPLLVLLPTAAWLWAGLPFADGERRGRPLRAVLAGIITGICCYGYPPVRVFLPLFLLLAILLGLPNWRQWIRSRQSVMAAIAFGLGLAITFGPLAFKHLTEPAVIGKRLAMVHVWQDGDSFLTKVGCVLARYPEHFGPDFLFINGDFLNIQSPPLSGMFHCYMMPMMILGVLALAGRLRKSLSARVLLAWLLAYPVGDCLATHPSMHALRSLPGLPALVLLATLGVMWAVDYLRTQPRAAWLCGAVGAVAVVTLNTQFWMNYFGEYSNDSGVYRRFHADLIQGFDWLRPRLDRVDAVFCTTEQCNMPYVVMLVAMDYDPCQWFTEQHEVREWGGWDQYLRCGKFRFVYENSQWDELKRLRANGRPDRVAFIIRPSEVAGLQPDQIVRMPSGHVLLWLCEVEM